MSLLTVGHGTLPEADFLDLLGAAGVAQLVDVRSHPGSRRHPQFGQHPLERSLPSIGVDYSWDRRLGGRRRPDPQSSNVALRHPAFRGYADHMQTSEFRTALDVLVSLATTESVVVMCAESLWWRCHRRLLADAVVLLASMPVMHLFHDGRLEGHSPSPEVRILDSRLVYDLESQARLL